MVLFIMRDDKFYLSSPQSIDDVKGRKKQGPQVPPIVRTEKEKSMSS
jgi:hypothetical protein